MTVYRTARGSGSGSSVSGRVTMVMGEGSPADYVSRRVDRRWWSAHHRGTLGTAWVGGADVMDRPTTLITDRRDDLGTADGGRVEGADRAHLVAELGQARQPLRRRVRLQQHGQVIAPPQAERSGGRRIERETGGGNGGGRV